MSRAIVGASFARRTRASMAPARRWRWTGQDSCRRQRRAPSSQLDSVEDLGELVGGDAGPAAGDRAHGLAGLVGLLGDGSGVVADVGGRGRCRPPDLARLSW